MRFGITSQGLLIFLLSWSWSVKATERYLEAMALMAEGGSPAVVFRAVADAAEAGDRAAAFTLSELFRDGYGVDADPALAAEWLMRASGPGRSTAQFALASAYLHGRGVTQDSARAVFWLREAAGRGHTGAQLLLAGMLQRGDGAGADAEEARRWLFIAARGGSDEARYQLAVQLGLPEGESWLRAAAANGHAQAQRQLGVHLAAGGSLPTDERLARQWLEQAASNGDARAMLITGLFQMHGRGGPEDLAAAYDWLKRAELSGEPEATRYRLSLETRLDLSAQASSATAVVSRHTPEPLQLKSDGRVLPADRLLAHGSGFHIDAAGHLLTNHHVIDLCGELRTPSGQRLQLIASVDDNDLALLRAEAPADAWLALAEAPAPVGSAIRVPQAKERDTQGRITAHQRPGFDRRFIRFNGRLQIGSSGAPVLDSENQVVGVTVAKLRPGAAYEATGVPGEAAAFAVRPELVRGFLDLYELDLPAVGQGDVTDAVTRVECWY